MTQAIDKLNALLVEKKLVKVIAGIDNYDPDHVAQIVRAATVGGAGAVDVAARPDIVKLARQTADLPVFASSINPQDLAIAVSLGADVAEIGNFDALYKDGFYLTADDVLDLTRKTQALLPAGTPICVTVPGHLTRDKQMLLAKRLAELGVFMLQTEGASKVIGIDRQVSLMSREDKIRLTLDNTRALAGAVSIPVMTASGLDAGNAQHALSAGASALGVGHAVNQFHNEEDMLDALMPLMAAVHAFNATVTMAMAG